jgi:hypothetical protein
MMVWIYGKGVETRNAHKIKLENVSGSIQLKDRREGGVALK